jgi:hypothetical protein
MSSVIRVSAIIPSIHVTGGRIHEDGWRDSFGAERSNVSIVDRAKSEPHSTFSALSLNNY